MAQDTPTPKPTPKPTPPHTPVPTPQCLLPTLTQTGRPPQLPRVVISREQLLVMLQERGWELPIPLVEAPPECKGLVEVCTPTNSLVLRLARLRLDPAWPVSAAEAADAVAEYRTTCVSHGHVSSHLRVEPPPPCLKPSQLSLFPGCASGYGEAQLPRGAGRLPELWHTRRGR